MDFLGKDTEISVVTVPREGIVPRARAGEFHRGSVPLVLLFQCSAIACQAPLPTRHRTWGAGPRFFMRLRMAKTYEALVSAVFSVLWSRSVAWSGTPGLCAVGTVPAASETDTAPYRQVYPVAAAFGRAAAAALCAASALRT